MPLSIPDALVAHEDAAVTKATTARTQLPRYLLSAMLAGAFVGVAVLLMLMVSAPLIADQNPAARLVQGAVFGVALTLVVFAGARMNRTGAFDVPSASKRPPLATVKPSPLLKHTTAPGWIVRTTPALTVTEFVTT